MIVYAILASNLFGIGQKIAPSPKDYVNEPDSQSVTQLEKIYLQDDETYEAWHFAPPTTQEQLDAVCDRIHICDTIGFEGKFSIVEKYNYTKIISKIVEFIDNNNTLDKSILPTIKSIDISKKQGEKRWSAKRYTILFNIQLVQSNTEFIGLATHEIGHITDLWYLQGTSTKKDKNYTEFDKIVFAINDPSLSFYKISRSSENIRKASAKPKDFCSGYGMSDPFEDFAECFNLYLNHNTLFKQMARTNTILKEKYNSIANLFEGKFISASQQDLLLIKQNITRRARDTTKIN